MTEENKREPVIVLNNGRGGCMEADLTENDEYTIIVKQGDRYAALVGDINLMMEMSLEPGEELKNGRIIVKESLEPLDPDKPDFLIKKKNGKVCKKGGKPIYSHSYFTYDRHDYDVIIEEDSEGPQLYMAPDI